MITVGKITGVFGIKGWVRIKSFTEPPENIVDYSPLWLKTSHGLKEMEIQDYQFRSQGLVMHIRGVDNRDAAEALGRIEIAVSEDQLAPLEKDEYYWHQLLGLKVISQFQGGEYILGEVKNLMETGANDVLVVRPTDDSIDDRERLVPFIVNVYVSAVDPQARVIRVEWDPDF